MAPRCGHDRAGELPNRRRPHDGSAGVGAVFVAFRTPTSVASRTVPSFTTATIATLDGPWQFEFPEGGGAPRSVTDASLGSWTASDDPGVRYFSAARRVTRPFRSCWDR